MPDRSRDWLRQAGRELFAGTRAEAEAVLARGGRLAEEFQRRSARFFRDHRIRRIRVRRSGTAGREDGKGRRRFRPHGSGAARTGRSALCAFRLLLALVVAAAGTPERAALGGPTYRIYPLRNGACKVKGRYAFARNEGDPKDYEYALYVWLVLGGERPILVDAGLEDVESMNRGAAEVFAEPIRQPPEETAAAQLRKFGLRREDIGHVLITHLHFDHVDELFQYTRATYCVGKKEWELASADDGRGSWCDGRILFPLLREESLRKRLRVVEDGEVLPGIEALWVGGHTPGSMAYRIRTAHGWAVLTGDTISRYENLERPVGVFSSLEEVEAAMRRIHSLGGIVLPSHDPRVLERWPPVEEGAPRYAIRPIRVGECQVTEEIAFQDRWGESERTRTFVLYVWLIEGAGRPVIVDTGPNPRHLEAFHRATARYIPGGVRQKPEEDTLAALRRAGVEPAEVSHVIVTHCHGDHYDYFPAFPNARFVVSRTEYEGARGGFPPDVAEALAARPDALQLVGDEEILPGIRAVPLGCHTEGSQGVLVRTWIGPALLTGDVAYLYENVEGDRPIRSPDPKACLEAMAKIRSFADVVLPAHDPEVLERWPSGVVGGRPR
ncbi:MAG: N-acyl homoserine lactonase family protein [Planctomycetota bacterium]